MPIEIRPVRASDWEELRKLYLASRRDAFHWLAPESLKLEDFDRDTQQEPILVAMEGEMVVGFISWWPPEDFVHNLFIAPGQQRRGVGRQLLAAVLKHIGRPATLKCSQPNAAALAFYRQLGWVVNGQGETDGVGYHLLSLSDQQAESASPAVDLICPVCGGALETVPGYYPPAWIEKCPACGYSR